MDDEKNELEPSTGSPEFVEEPMVVEHPKRRMRKGTIPKLLLSLLLFVGGVALIIFSIKYEAPSEKPEEENITNETSNETVVEVILNENDKVYLTGSNETTNDTEIDRHLLILKEDNTFVYSNSIKSTFAPVIGTYKVSNDSITLEEKVKYGSDNCFFKENWKGVYTGTYKEDTISIKIKDEKLDFHLGVLPEHIDYDPKWYIVDPIAGESPEEDSNDEWIDCDVIEN